MSESFSVPVHGTDQRVILRREPGGAGRIVFGRLFALDGRHLLEAIERSLESWRADRLRLTLAGTGPRAFEVTVEPTGEGLLAGAVEPVAFLENPVTGVHLALPRAELTFAVRRLLKEEPNARWLRRASRTAGRWLRVIGGQG